MNKQVNELLKWFHTMQKECTCRTHEECESCKFVEICSIDVFNVAPCDFDLPPVEKEE